MFFIYSSSIIDISSSFNFLKWTIKIGSSKAIINIQPIPVPDAADTIGLLIKCISKMTNITRAVIWTKVERKTIVTLPLPLKKLYIASVILGDIYKQHIIFK